MFEDFLAEGSYFRLHMTKKIAASMKKPRPVPSREQAERYTM
jgi:hypothetical protein